MDTNCMRFSFIDGRFRGHQFRARYRFNPNPIFLALICCPFERVQTILQDSNNDRRFKNTPEIFRKLPVREYYRGIRPILLRNGPSTFLYFYIYDVSSFWVQIGFGDDFIRGALGGVCATLYGYIFNVIKSRQQSILDPVESTRLKRYAFPQIFMVPRPYYAGEFTLNLVFGRASMTHH